MRASAHCSLDTAQWSSLKSHSVTVLLQKTHTHTCKHIHCTRCLSLVPSDVSMATVSGQSSRKRGLVPRAFLQLANNLAQRRALHRIYLLFQMLIDDPSNVSSQSSEAKHTQHEGIHLGLKGAISYQINFLEVLIIW